MIHKPGRYLVIYLLIVVGLGVLFMRLPSAFLPNEDQGILISQVSLPAGSSMERTLESVKAMERHYLEGREGQCERHLHRHRLQLQRARPEHRPGLRQPEGLVGAAAAKKAPSSP